MFGLITRRVPQVRNLKFFLFRRVPEMRRILLIESGSRELFNRLLPHLQESYPADLTVDLVTCYAGSPDSFDIERGDTVRVHEYNSRPARRDLYRKLRARHYDAVGIICSGEPIMTKWKWALAANVPAKIFIINENGDYFWLDRSNLQILRKFVLVRAGLSGAELVPALLRLLIFPFTVLYLLIYVGILHAQRRLRQS